jgi:hypothetical protein
MHPFPAEIDNLLLEAMTSRDRAALLEGGERVKFGLGDKMFSASGDVPYVYFPTSGMLSVVTRMADGASVEAVTIGKEGVSGPPIIIESGSISNVDCLCQLPGGGLRVPTRTFFDLRRQSSTFDELVDRYALVVLGQIAQTAACNRRTASRLAPAVGCCKRTIASARRSSPSRTSSWLRCSVSAARR